MIVKVIALLALSGLNLVLNTKLNIWCSGFVTGILVAILMIEFVS